MSDKTELLILTAVLGLTLLLIPYFGMRQFKRRRAMLADVTEPPPGMPPLPGSSAPPGFPAAGETASVFPAGDSRWFDWRDGVIALGLMVFFCNIMGPLPGLLMSIVKSGAKADGAPQPPVEFSLSYSVIAANLVLQMLIITAVLFYLCVLRKRPVVSFFGLKNGGFRGVAWRVLIWIPAVVVATIGGAIISGVIHHLFNMKLDPQPMVKVLSTSTDHLLISLMVLTASIGAPLQEELVFRGFFYGTGKRFLGRAGALIVTALLFGVIHNNLMSLIPLTLLGAVFALAYDHSKNLLTPVLLHAFFNGFQIAAILNGWFTVS